MPTSITTEAMVDQLFDLLTDQGVAFDDLAAAKAAARSIFQNWLGGDNALPAETMRTALNVLGRQNGFVLNQFAFTTTPHDGGPDGDGEVDILLPDGTLERIPGLAKLREQMAKGDPGGVSFSFAEETDASDPGDGGLRLNDSVPGSATAIYVDDLERGGADVSGWIEAFGAPTGTPKGIWTLLEAATGKLLVFSVTGAPTDAGGYWSVPVAYLAGQGGFAADGHLVTLFAPAGDVTIEAEAARDAAVAARDAAATSAQAVPAVKAHLGTDLSGVDTTTIGVTTPNTSNGNTSLIFGPAAAVAAPGPLASVSLRMSASGTGEIQVYELVSGSTYELVATFPVTVAAGANTFLDFGGRWLPVGARVHYKWLTGGLLRYVTGGASAYFNAADVSGEGDTADILTATNTVALSFDVLSDADNVAGQLAAVTATTTATAGGLSATQDGLASTRLAVGLGLDLTAIDGGDTDPDGATASASFCWFSKSHLTTLSRLDSFSARMSAAGSGLVFVAAPADGASSPVAGGSYELIASFLWTWGASGVQTFSDFQGLVAAAGSLIGFKSVSGGRPRYAAATLPGIWSTTAAALVNVGDTTTISSASNTVALAFEASVNGQALAPRVAALEAGTGLAGDDFNAPVYQVRETFRGASLPSGWVENGGWTVSDGLIAPGAGGWDVAAYFDDYSSAGFRTIIARLEVLDASGAFGISSDPQEGFSGGQAIIDGAAGTLGLYTYDGSSSAGTLVTSAPLSAALTVGDILMLTVKRDDLVITATVTNARTQATATATYDYTASATPSRRPFFHGKPGVVDHDGSGVKALYFAAWADSVRRLDTLFIGDSNGEGSNDPSVGSSWMNQLAALQPGRRLVCARGGDETANFMLRMATDLQALRPRRVVLAMGTNDTDLNAWRANLAIIIAAVEAIGAEPVLCTFPPRTGAQTLRDNQNADVLGDYFGPHRVIDVAASVTDANDRVTWDAARVMADLIHMNAAGQAAVFAQAQIDVPELGVSA